MRSYNLAVALFAIIIPFFSCKAPEARYKPAETEHGFDGVVAGSVKPAGTVEPVEAVDSAETVKFDPSSVTAEVYQETKQDIIRFIEDLDAIIKGKRYSEWRQYLDTDYYQYINSPDYLLGISKSEILASKKIVLSNAYDYFIHVVVPSRSNDRVDDIEFVSETRIRAINIDNGRRVILYNLAKTQNGWKIVTPSSTTR